MSQKMGLRERKKISTRNAILDGGLEVFSTLGYERSTITNIVAASGLSVGTFYNHFGDKKTVYAVLVNNMLSQLREVLNETRNKAPTIEKFVMGAFFAYSDLMIENPKMQQLIGKSTSVFRAFIAEEGGLVGIIEDLERDFHAAVNAGLSPKLPINLMTSVIIASSVELFTDEVDAKKSREKAEFLGNLFLGGIHRLANS